MNIVPFDFCQRVLTTRKCCEGGVSCSCARPRFAAQIWSPSETKKQCISFHIGPDNGRCKYVFRHESAASEHLSMDELMSFPDLRNVRICEINIRKYNNINWMRHDVVEMEKLLKFVSVFANEPALVLHGYGDQFYDSPNGKELLKWLEERWFSHIQAVIFSSNELRIVEKQFSRWKPTDIAMITIGRDSEEFWKNRLMCGDLRRLRIGSFSPFSSTLLQRIIRNVLESAEDYAKKTLDIQVRFDDSTENVLEQMAEDGLCTVEELRNSLKYTFEKQPVLLTVECRCGKWRICSGKTPSLSTDAR